MKLTKGRINKLLKARKQTFKQGSHRITDKSLKSSHFTLRNKHRPLNLINKSLRNYVL